MPDAVKKSPLKRGVVAQPPGCVPFVIPSVGTRRAVSNVGGGASAGVSPLGLYYIQQDHRIPSTVLAEVVGTSRKVLERFARGTHHLSTHRREIILAYLRFIGVPEADLANAFTSRPRPAGEHRGRGLDNARIHWLKAQVERFRSATPTPGDNQQPELIQLEAPVLTRSHLSVNACTAFGFLDRDGNALDPFYREFKDPAHGQYVWPGYTEAFDTLIMAARERALLALVAPPASGKSFLLARARAALRNISYEICEPSLLTKGRCTEGTILNAILAGIAGAGIKPLNSLDRRCQQIYDILLQEKGRRNVVLIVDEAQDLPPLALKVLKRLYDWSYGVYDNLLAIILVGHPALRNTLLRDLSVRETGRRAIIHELAPLDSIERYLDWRITKALGREFESRALFSEDGLRAVEALLDFEYDPRRDWRPLIVNSLLQAALELAYRKAEPVISAGIVRQLTNAVREG